ncbi:ABC transporter permease [candidate division KSB1 bacterium]|nr:ABC transporter permease [candidate division KSB1 bacterium]
MFRNYIKIAWRNLAKQKMFSAINIGGFALGIAACLLIALYISDEFRYDRHFPNGDRLYRVILVYNVNGETFKGAAFPAPFAGALKEEFPEVEQVGRLNQTEFFGAGSNEIRRSDKVMNTHEEGFAYADQGLLDILQLPMIYGDPAHVLDQPGTIVISQQKAAKYFPNENPIGKTFIINNNESKPYQVTGVMDFPTFSHFQSDYLLTIEGGFYPGEQTNWRSSSYYTYVLLHPGTDVAQLESKFSVITRKYIIPCQQQDGYVDAEKLADIISYELQPVSDIHLKSADIQDDLHHGDIRFIWLFGIIAGFILVIAGINFINLSTAKSANRAKEVGLRKTIGSNKANLIGQFLTESVLYSILSFVSGMLLAYLFLPYFNMLSAKSLTVPWAEWWRVLPLFVFFSVIIGILAGFYPSFYLSSFKPVSVLKGNLSRGSKSSRLRSGLVIFQFTISIILITGTLIISRQVNYILTKKVGFDKEQVLLLNGANTLGEQIASFKNELLKIPEVKSVSISDFLPVSGTKRDGNALWNEGKSKTDPPVYGQFWRVDHDYIKTMGMNIFEGRNFSKEMPTDSKAAVINRTLATELGLTNPVGKRIQNQWHVFEVIGIVEDFHYESLKKDIGGVCLVLGNSPNIASVKVNTTNMSGLISSVTKVWDSFSPNQPIRYTFLDESFANMYADVQRMGRIFSTFALLAIIVACLGLLALSSFMAAQRTKEIGVRKVLGASISNVVFDLSKNFLVLVVLANIIAWPVAYYFMNKWLQDFVYRIHIGWWMFILSGGIALLIALVTVSWVSIRTALTNPVESLHYE